MQRSGNVGISALFDIKKIVVADGTATAQDWMPQEYDIISTALISENYAYIGGRSEELDAYILKAYDMEGNHLLTFGEKGKDGDDWLAYVSQIMEIPEGFFGIDANMRDLYIWGPDASVAKQDDGSILVALTQDRDDDSATELLLYRLSGF